MDNTPPSGMSEAPCAKRRRVVDSNAPPADRQLAKKDVYHGEVEDGRVSGVGKMTYADGSVYEGEFKAGSAEGTGKMIYSDGCTYEGEWKDGRCEGEGRFVQDGIEHTGSFLKGWKHGPGVTIFPDSSRYEGEYRDDKMSGKGIYTAGGYKYEGEFENYFRHGQGLCTYAEGHTREGTWVRGNFHGQGKGTFTDGAKYEGQWEDNFRHGRGIYSYPDGSTYDGEWFKGKKDGHGVHVASTKERYEGGWVDGERTGQGKEVLPSGYKFEGTFAADYPVKGVLEDADAVQYDVVFKKDNMLIDILDEGFDIFSRYSRRPTSLLPDIRRHWVSDGKGPSKLYEVDPASDEYKQISADFGLTMDVNTIKHIQRVENHDLQKAFQVTHRLADKPSNPFLLRGKMPVCEQVMLESMSGAMSDFDPTKHRSIEMNRDTARGGRKAEYLHSIVNDPIAGFLPLKTGTSTGEKYGKGTYFAASAMYSSLFACDADYSVDDTIEVDLKQMLVAEVVVGRWAQGAQGVSEYPFIPGSTSVRYASLVDDVANPRIFVVPHASQAYPAYVITYQP